MKKGYQKGDNHVLAGLIFILWSVGVLVMPHMSGSDVVAISALPGYLSLAAIVYFLMHVGVFCYTLVLISRLTYSAKAFHRHFLQLLLYSYVLVSLGVSFYYTFGMFRYF